MRRNRPIATAKPKDPRVRVNNNTYHYPHISPSEPKTFPFNREGLSRVARLVLHRVKQFYKS